jgi:hypothetical protein
MGVNNGWEVFYTQMRAAVRSQETLQTRLEYVVMIVSSLSRDHFPSDETWGRFETLKRATTRLPARFEGEGTLHATTSQMTDSEAGKLLELCFDIFNEMAKADGAEDNRFSLAVKNDEN